MKGDELKAVVRRIVNEWLFAGDPAVIVAYHALDYVCHRPPYPDIEDTAGYKAWGDSFRAAFPGARYAISALTAEEDTVVAQLTYRGTHTGAMGPNLPPTGKQVSGLGCIVWRWAHGKIVEEWQYWDELGFWQQLGFRLVPPA